MKHLLLAGLILFLLIAPARAEGLDDALLQTLDSLSLDAWERAWEYAFPDGADFQEMLMQLARGEASLDGAGVLEEILSYFLGALRKSLRRAAALLLPAIFYGILQRMRSSFQSKALGSALEAACFLLIAGAMARDMGDHAALAGDAVSRMADLMQALFPLLLTLLAAVGGTAGAAFFQPAVVAASGTMTALVQSAVLPLSMGAAATAIVDQLSPRMHLGRLSAFLKSAASWLLGVGFTVFISVTALQSLGVAAADGISIRTAKYAVDHFVPVVGGMFADTMDTLVGASLLIKNALGVTGLLLLIFQAGGSMAETLAAVMLYRACAALLQPLGEDRIGRCMQDFSNILMLLFIIQLSVGAMFLLLVAQMLVVGNLTVMLR